MNYYSTINQAKEAVQSLYPEWSHERIFKEMGIGRARYDQIRKWDTVAIADKMTPIAKERIDNFLSRNHDRIKIKSTRRTPLPAARPLPPLMKALDNLSRAADVLKRMGYVVEVDVRTPQKDDQ